MTELASNRLCGIILGIALIVGAALFRFTADDGYIVARYAENLIHDGALVFNAGERVSALTSPLHAIIEAGLRATTGETILSYKLLAALLLVGAGLVLARHWNDDPIALPITLFLLTAPPLILWTFGGLETPLLLLLVALFASTAHAGGPIDRRRLTTLSVLAGLAFLTRFDSALFTAPVLLHAALRNRKPRTIAAALGTGAIIPAAWLIFAALYYGDIFPTSFYVKTPTLRGERMIESAVNIVEFLLFTGFAPLALAGVLVAGKQAPSALREHLRRALPLLIGMGMIIGYGQLTGMIHMMFSFRMFVPYIPVLALLLCDLYRRISEPLARLMASPWRGVAMAAIVAGLLFQGAEGGMLYFRSLNGLSIVGEYRHIGVAEYADGFMPALAAGAYDVEAHWRTLADSSGRAPRVATFAAGALPYHYRDAYIFEPLVSYRRACKAIGAESADYIQLLAPTLDAAAASLPKPIGHYRLVSWQPITFDGAPQNIFILYDPSPACNPLPSTVNGPCVDCIDEHTVSGVIRYDR